MASPAPLPENAKLSHFHPDGVTENCGGIMMPVRLDKLAGIFQMP
jgi:hypothetical protein